MIIATLIFIVTAPLLILYASGYRLDKTFSFATTGGINISAPFSGVEIYLGTELVRTTSIFQKSVFVQNLKPGSYTVKVRKDSYQDWNKTLLVFPETVTDAHSFILPTNVVVKEIPPKLLLQGGGQGTATSTRSIDNPDFLEVVELFKPVRKVQSIRTASTTKMATSTDIEKEFRKLVVERVDGKLRITWAGNIESKPSYFCQNEDCKSEIFITPNSELKSFDFFPGRGDLIIMSLVDGIYVSEIDDRSAQNIQKLYSGENVDFRIQGGDTIFLQKGTKYYSVSL